MGGDEEVNSGGELEELYEDQLPYEAAASLDSSQLYTALTCSCLQSSSVLLANIRDSCSDYVRMTGP